MRWRLTLLIMLGLMYYGYIRGTAETAQANLQQWQTGYLNTIEKASAGEIPTMPAGHIK